MADFKCNGMVFHLAFTLDAMDAMEDATGVTLSEQRFSIATKADRAQLLEVLAILAEAGAIQRGVKYPEIYDAQWFRENLTPGMLIEASKAVANTINDAMRMETEADSDDDEVDLVLEEIKKKESPAT